MEEQKQPDWVNYWNSLASKLGAHINTQQISEVDRYLTSSFGYFSFCTEDLSSKISKHNTDAPNVYPMLIQIQDMLRANIHNQNYLLLSSSAFSLRAGFEIRLNLKYIYAHQNPSMMLQRLAAFARYEELVGRRKIANGLVQITQEEKEFAKIHSYWAKEGKLKDNVKWNGEGKTVKDICTTLNMMEDYRIFSMTSKFIHGSPVIKNLYSSPQGLNPIPKVKTLSNFTMLGTATMMEALREFMDFFGVKYDPVDFAFLDTFFGEAMGVLKK